MSEKSLWLFIFILLYASYCFFWGVRGSRNNSDNPEENNENTFSSLEVNENNKEEDDLEIPAFLRRQKN